MPYLSCLSLCKKLPNIFIMADVSRGRITQPCTIHSSHLYFIFGVIGLDFKVEDWKNLIYPLAVQHQMEAELQRITSLRFGPGDVHLFLFELKELAIVIYYL